MAEEQLIKRWDDWSAGIGHPIDDGQTPGMYKASGLLGLPGELRVAPLKNTITADIDTSHHYQYYIEEPVIGKLPLIDATSSGSANNDTTVTVSHTITSDTAKPNTILLVWVFVTGATASTSSLTYNGTSLTKYQNATHTNDVLRGNLWYVVAPSSGANDIIYTTTGTRDIIIIAASYYHANQSAPLHARWGESGTGTAIAKTSIDSSTSEILIMGSATAQNTTDTKDGSETLIATVLNAGNDLRSTASYKIGATSGSMTHTLGNSGAWINIGSSILGAPPGPSHLYSQRGGRVGNTPCYLDKVGIFNSGFGILESGSYTLTNLKKAGQPTRYQGFWYFPDGDEYDPRKLTPAVGAPSGELAASSAWTDGGADHLSNMSGQMIAALKDNGFAILSVDGTPTTTDDWGSYFQAGDKNERTSAIAGFQGLSFVLTPEGLFSFNQRGRSGLVFEDFRSWRDVFDNRPISAWKGGLIVAAPTGGIMFYRPRQLPISIGVATKGKTMPPSGVTQVTSGRYMGLHATGDYLWAIYQPDVTSTSVEVQCGYTQTGDPTELTWQVISTTTLNDAQHLLGLFVSVQSQPLSASYYTPVIWFGDSTDLAYIVLDQQAGPFRSRSDTHKLNISADAYMSELRFSKPVELTDLYVYTSSDMTSGDEFQISFIANGTGNDVDVGRPIKGAGRHHRNIDRHEVTSLILHVNWVATSTSDRVPPVIQAIELFGTREGE